MITMTYGELVDRLPALGIIPQALRETAQETAADWGGPDGEASFDEIGSLLDERADQVRRGG